MTAGRLLLGNKQCCGLNKPFPEWTGCIPLRPTRSACYFKTERCGLACLPACLPCSSTWARHSPYEKSGTHLRYRANHITQTRLASVTTPAVAIRARTSQSMATVAISHVASQQKACCRPKANHAGVVGWGGGGGFFRRSFDQDPFPVSAHNYGYANHHKDPDS